MKLFEFEKMLMDPEGLKKLTERATGFKEKYGELGDAPRNPASQVRPVEPRPHELRPTPDEIRANDSNYVVRSAVNINVARFLSARKEADSLSALRLVCKMCKCEPSEANQLFLEIAINQLTSERVLDENGKRTVKEAIKVLTSADASEKKTGEEQ